MMEKRVLIAAILSSVFLAWYSQMVVKQTAHKTIGQGSAQVTVKSVESAAQQGNGRIAEAIPPNDEHEASIYMESPDLKLEIGQASGAVRACTLKRFQSSS